MSIMANWKIESIKIENFKFFKEPFSFNLKGKNVLLYGENGAGKSSIYWSFYTHFQAYMYFLVLHSRRVIDRDSACLHPGMLLVGLRVC